MARNSRHKSHRRSNHRYDSNSKVDTKKVSKRRKGKEKAEVRVSRDLASVNGEKRKSSALYSQSREGNDLYGHANGDDFVVSKRRKRKKKVAGGGDRWNGDGNGGSVAVDKEDQGESFPIVSEKAKHLIESKSKPRRISDGNEKKEDHAGLSIKKVKSKKAKTELGQKTEMDKPEDASSAIKSSRKEYSQHENSKENSLESSLRSSARSHSDEVESLLKARMKVYRQKMELKMEAQLLRMKLQYLQEITKRQQVIDSMMEFLKKFGFEAPPPPPPPPPPDGSAGFGSA